MRLQARTAYAPHASGVKQRRVRGYSVVVDRVLGDYGSVAEVWKRLASPGSATNSNPQALASVEPVCVTTATSPAPSQFRVQLSGCVWTVLLRAAELPLEQTRSDQKVRSRSRHLHHRASSKPPATAAEKDLHRKAMFLARKGRSMESLRLLSEGMQQYPRNSFFPHSMGVMMSNRHQLDDAQRFLRMALDIDGENSAALQALGRVYGKLGDGAQARSMFEHAVKVDPGNAAAYQAWALLEKDDGNIQKAQQLLEVCLEGNPKHEPSLHALAKLHLELCHFVQARKLLQRALRINPSHSHSWTTLGELCYYQGDPAQARRIYEQMIAYCGEDSVAYATWAHMETRMGDNGKARRLLERAIEIDPRNTRAHTQLLTLLCNDPFLEHMAPAQLRAALQRFPNNVYIRHLSAVFLIGQGKEDAAQGILEQLASAEPDNGKVAQTQALLHIRHGEREVAAQCLRRGMSDSNRENALVCTEELAKLALSEGRPDVAQDLLQYGAAQSTPTSRYLREWGLVERKLGNTATARSLFQQSVEARAMDIRSWVAWAVLERSCDDLPKALEVLRQALTVAPKVATLWYLYCDTACKCLPLRTCREAFYEAHKCVPRCPQTYLLEATLEWKNGYEDRARRAFVQGGRLSAGTPECYSPLFQAWAHFEEFCGNSDEAADLVAQCAKVQEKEQRHSRPLKSAGVEELVNLLGRTVPVVIKVPL